MQMIYLGPTSKVEISSKSGTLTLADNFLTRLFCESFLPLWQRLSLNFKRIVCNSLGVSPCSSCDKMIMVQSARHESRAKK